MFLEGSRSARREINSATLCRRILDKENSRMTGVFIAIATAFHRHARSLPYRHPRSVLSGDLVQRAVKSTLRHSAEDPR